MDGTKDATTKAVQMPRLPLQLERYLSQSTSDDSTVWSMTVDSVEDSKKKISAGNERALQNITRFSGKFKQSTK